MVALLALIGLKILSPMITVELCIVAFHRYGHLALEPEIFLGEKEIRDRGAKKIRFPIRVQWWSFGPKRFQANHFLVSKWKKVVCAPPSWWIDALHVAGNSVRFLQLDEPKMSVRGSCNSLDQTFAHLQMTNAEIERGRAALYGLGVNPDKPYACLVVRDGGHYASLGEKESNGYSFMNFDIANFEQAALSLVQRGYQVVRMGAGSEIPFGANHPGIVDYANSPNRSAFLDVFIAATCSFAVSTQTGPDAVCLAFRRPVCYIDITRFSQFFFGTKLAWWNPTELWQGDRRLTLQDILRGPIFWIKDPNDFIREGIRQVRSSAERIDHLVMSFVDAFENHFHQTSSEDVTIRTVQKLIEDQTGAVGREQFGCIASVLNPGFVRQSGDWYLV
jgi:putative glycosyltransferase (TIGR04372 family)